MIERFLEQVRGTAYDRANDPGDGELRLTALLEDILERLEESGVLSDAHSAFFRREGHSLHAEVHAYSLDTEDDVLTLFYFIDGNQATPFDRPWSPQPVGKDAVDRGFRRLEAFVKLVETGKADDIEESLPSAELVVLVQETVRDRRRIAFNVITTGTLSDRAVAVEERAGLTEVWDLIRLARVCGGTGDEPVSIDFSVAFDRTLACLTTSPAPDGIQVLLTAIPGEILARIYNTYRARLLERNVRSFLQFTGKVNQGIRDTILTNPSRFLTYNNGLAATAAEVVMEDLGDGLARIRAVRDFQIVNGGQTTASIASAVRRDQADVSAVSVAMKLSVVPREMLDNLVPLIARYANTQNRIQEADFSANHPWHVALERLSRETWTPAAGDTPRGTRWFYERSRGQYADESATLNSPAAKRRFREDNPTTQRFTKTDLAKFILSWDQRPDIVSRGAQKAFVAFMKQLSGAGRSGPEKSDLERTVALAILFRTAERLYGQLDFTGYRAQVVTYSIARLSQATQRRLPWAAIWDAQEIPEQLVAALKLLLIGVRDLVISPPSGRNVTEWCKREECVTAVMLAEIDMRLPDANAWQPYSVFSAYASSKPQATGALLQAISAIPAEVWFSVSSWAKEQRVLQAWQRSLAFSLGRIAATRSIPSLRQAIQGRKLLLLAIEKGFIHTDLINERIAALEEAEEA